MSLEATFRGKHAIITGGSLGIGLAVARRLAGLGAGLTLIARRRGPLEEARAAILGEHPGAVVRLLELDVADEAAVAAALPSELAAQPADILINNAGVARPGRFLELEPAEFHRQMAVNYFGAIAMTRAVVPHLEARGGGYVVNVGSLASVVGVYGYTAYSGSKFALFGFSECLRAELLPKKIDVSILLPPDTDTPMHHGEQPFMPEETKAIVGSLRLLTADEVADALLEGMEKRRFEIVPGLDSRLSVIANRWMPGVVRAYCDLRLKWSQRGRG